MKSPHRNVIRFPAARVYRDWEHTHANLRNHQTLNVNCKAPPTQTENVGTCCVPSRVIPVSVDPPKVMPLGGYLERCRGKYPPIMGT